MTKIATLLIALLFAIPSVIAQDTETRVAKVDYSEIEHLIESVVLAQPANKQLGERFKVEVAKSQDLQRQMQEAIMNGGKVDLAGAAAGMLGESEDSKKVKVLCEKHLLELIETTLGDKYHIVLKEGYRSSLLFTRIAIDDVTVLLKQELLRQLPTEKNRP